MLGRNRSNFQTSFNFTLLLLALCFAMSTHAQQRPLLTEDVDVIPPGTARIEAGIDFVQRAKFPLSGLTGDLTRVGVIGINIGLSPNVEFQIDGTLQNFEEKPGTGFSEMFVREFCRKRMLSKYLPKRWSKINTP